MNDWNPALYLKFAEARTRPALDLALRAQFLLEGRRAADLSVVDLGCGPGNSTAVLAEVFRGCTLLGMDSSPAMIEAARATGLEAAWQVADVETWQPGARFDLLFSNAMLQWARDPGAVLAAMTGWLAPGGIIAVQVPGNGESGLHRALRSVAARPGWSKHFAGLDDAIRYREPPFWQDSLEALGCEVDCWESTYWHVLPGHGALIEWYAGTGMRPWLERLDAAGQEAFKAEVLDTARPSYPERTPTGTVHFPFRRIFFTARRG